MGELIRLPLKSQRLAPYLRGEVQGSTVRLDFGHEPNVVELHLSREQARCLGGLILTLAESENKQ